MKQNVEEKIRNMYTSRLRRQNPFIPTIMIALSQKTNNIKKKINLSCYLLTTSFEINEMQYSNMIIANTTPLNISEKHEESLMEIILSGRQENIFIENTADYKKIIDTINIMDSVANSIIRKIKMKYSITPLVVQSNYKTKLQYK